MSQKLSQDKDLLMKIDRYMKAGRFTFSLLTADQAKNAVLHELILDYGTDEHGMAYGSKNGFPTKEDGTVDIPRPKLFVLGQDGSRVNIETESAKIIKDFMDNFFEVSTERTKHGEPSMWLKLIANDDGSTTYGEENTKKFYEYIKNNKDILTPYVMQTFKNGKRDVLVPFITADHVFYDVSKIIAGEKIRSMDDVFKLLHNMIKEVGDNIRATIEALQARIDSTLSMLVEKAAIQDRAIAALRTNINEFTESHDALKVSIKGILDRVGKAFTKKSMFVGKGSILKLKFNPAKQGFKPAIDSFERAADIYAACLFITGQVGTSEIFVEIGPGSHIGFDKIAFFMNKNASHEISQPNMRIAQVGSPLDDNMISFAEQIATGEYVIQFNYDMNINIWSKYIDYMEVTTDMPTAELKRVLDLVRINRSRLSDLGVIPQQNSLTCRTSTTYLNKGIALADNCILVSGSHRFNDLKEFDYNNAEDTDMLAVRGYIPPRETLTIDVGNTLYNPYDKKFYTSASMWRPRMSLDVIVYNNTDPNTRLYSANNTSGVFKTEIKKKLQSIEIERGVVGFSIDFEDLDIAEGWLYDVIVSAPGYISSPIIRGVFKF